MSVRGVADLALEAVRGGNETTGKCGIGPYGFGQTKECKAHDECVDRWGRRTGRPAADVICLPKLPAAAASAVRCAVDPTCPK